jgi:hypothetical protein
MVLGFASGLEWRQAITTFTQQAGKPPAIYQLFFDVEREDSITREQMAAFLARSFDLAPSPAPTSSSTTAPRSSKAQ